MAGISVIVRKEISDVISNRTFLLAVGILMFSMVLAGIVSGDTYFKTQVTRTNPASWKLVIIENLTPTIRVLGALVALAFSFNSINKERTEGSLKVLLSYPIYRDKIILGKIIAGLIVISVVTVASMAVAFSLYFFITSIALTMDWALRLVAAMLLAILLLCGYLGLGMFLSITFRDPKTTLLVAFLFLGLFNSETFFSIGQILSKAVYGPDLLTSGVVSLNPQASALRDFISALNPSWSFTWISLNLSWYLNLGIDMPNSLWNVIVDHMTYIAVLIIIPVITFAASYALFTRRDVT